MPESEKNFQEDISLRDIYLIIRKNLLLLLFLPLAIAVITGFIVSFLPKEYEAESVSLVTPSPIRLSATATLSYRPPIEVSFEAYETLAESRGVLEQAIERAGVTMTFTEFGGRMRQLVGPQRPDQVVPLLVMHQVTNRDPELAARLANSWAEVSLETIQKSLLTNLDPLIEQISQEVAGAKARLERAERALEAFEARSFEKSLATSLDHLAQLIASADNETLSISELKLASIDVNVGFLLNQGVQAAQAQEKRDFKTSSGLNLSQEIVANQAFVTALEQESLSADLRDELSYRRSLAKSLEARQSLLAEQLVSYQQKQSDLQTQLAALNREKAELMRELKLAQTAYDSLVSLEPTLGFLAKITPSSTQLLNLASVPSEASGPRVLLSAAIALLLAALLVLLVVFFREAVKAKTP